MIFEPTKEWQLVPEGVSIPGGLEIRMDFQEGGTWARLPEDTQNREPLLTNKVNSSNELALHEEQTIFTSPFDYSLLTDLEDKAHDYFYGSEIINNYGSSLFSTFQNSLSKHSNTAGRIITTCLRNNGKAALLSKQSCPQLATSLVLEERSILILSALLTTQEGLSIVKEANILPKIRRDLAYSKHVSPKLAIAVRKFMENLASIGYEDEICEFLNALTQVIYTTGSSELRNLAIAIVEHTGAFESLHVHCKPQPGLLSAHEENKRAVVSSARFENPKAIRNHFDEL